MEKRLTVFLLTFSILISLMLPLSAFFPSREDAELYDNIIRLHVLANSDSDEDQAIKLKVRDRILDTAAELLSEVVIRDEAENLLRENLDILEKAANEALAENGSTHTASVTLTKEVYPTRIYGEITLPSGEYTSLRVLIGSAEGKNWWCILFPKLCVGNKRSETDVAVIADEDELIEAGLTRSQVRIITGNSPDVVVKFRLLEFFERLFS